MPSNEISISGPTRQPTERSVSPLLLEQHHRIARPHDATVGGNVRIGAASASIVEIPTLNPAVLLFLSLSLAWVAVRQVKARDR